MEHCLPSLKMEAKTKKRRTRRMVKAFQQVLPKEKLVTQRNPPCKHCNKKGHPPYKCWRRSDVKCSKCNQLGHETVVCKNNSQQQEAKAKLLRVRRKINSLLLHVFQADHLVSVG